MLPEEMESMCATDQKAEVASGGAAQLPPGLCGLFIVVVQSFTVTQHVRLIRLNRMGVKLLLRGVQGAPIVFAVF